MQQSVEIVLHSKGLIKRLIVPFGTSLREALLINGFTPYTGKNTLINCRGMGICSTCVVTVIENNEKKEKQSCQIQCFKPLEILLQ